MTGGTHVAVGIAVALAYCNYKGMPLNADIIVPVITGSVGGLIPDVDKGGDEDNKNKRIKYIISVTGLLFVLFTLISEKMSLDKLLSSIIIFVLMVFIFTFQNHRYFSHSLLAMGIISFSMFRIDFDWGMTFLLSYLSHLILDLFNCEEVRLFNFIPKLKKGFCFDLVSSSNITVNLIITGISISIIICTLLLMSRT